MTLIVLQESWIVEQTWFPTLIITAEGHLLRIAIAVNIGATLVEKVVLLDINSRVRDHTMITRLERLASALKACSDELHRYYSGLRKDVSPEMKYQLRFPRPTIMPTSTDLSLPLTVETLQSALGGPNSFPRLEFKAYLQRDGRKDLSFIVQDTKPSEKAKIMQGLFVAEMTLESGAKEEVAVKFAETYGIEAHRRLYELRIAPKLHYHHRVVGNLYMVVMERVKGKQWSKLERGSVDQTAFKELRTQLGKFHEQGFVHGDLRNCNVMLDYEGKAKVIDFDWAGKEEDVRYPKNINMDLVTDDKELHGDVRPYGIIKKEHDEFALSVLGKQVFGDAFADDEVSATHPSVSSTLLAAVSGTTPTDTDAASSDVAASRTLSNTD